MNPIPPDISDLIRRTKEEYADSYESMTWLTPQKAKEASDLRMSLLKNIFEGHPEGPGRLFSDTKIYTYGISPG